MLNAIQALIFSVLTLMFIVLAIESHHEEEGHVAEEALDAIDGTSEAPAPARPLTAPPGAHPSGPMNPGLRLGE